MRRDYLPRLNSAQVAICDLDVVHGFMPGRSPVTAALPHIGFMYTLSLDIEDFFRSVAIQMLPLDVAVACRGTVNKPGILFPILKKEPSRARQGLPTSPAIANIAAVKTDDWFKLWCVKHNAVYTRYADDLSISSNSKDDLLELRAVVAYRCQHLTDIEVGEFYFNPRKTRLQWAGPDGTWTREVVGVGVGKDGIKPLRSTRMKLRAVKHQGNSSHAAGLEEWCRLRHPRPVDYSKIAELHLSQVALERLSTKP